MNFFLVRLIVADNSKLRLIIEIWIRQNIETLQSREVNVNTQLPTDHFTEIIFYRFTSF